MRAITAPLFNELKSQNAKIDVGWLVIRQDGERYAFTSSDTPFTYNGDVYTPTNGFNPSAIVSKANMSVDNMECQVLDNDLITDQDLRAGLWDLAQVQVFWIRRDKPEWGVVPLRGGMLGEIVIKTGQCTTQLRSLFQQMQQPLGVQFTIVCNAQLGDARCKVKLDAPAWEAHTSYKLGLLTDANVGDIVKPSTPNGFWYVANYTTRGGEAERSPTAPGQGLSGNDDLGPNDNTQVAVGAPNDTLRQFTYQGANVDIFGIQIALALMLASGLASYVCN